MERTEVQKAASRANGRKSRGPSTQAGKQRSSRNAVRRPNPGLARSAVLEGTVARNMDRGTIYSFGPPTFPTTIGDDALTQKTGLALVARLEQRLGRQLIAGFRWDAYTPDLQQGQNLYRGYTPMLGVFLIEQLRWSVEYSFIRDDAHAAGKTAAGHEIHLITTYLHAAFEL